MYAVGNPGQLCCHCRFVDDVEEALRKVPGLENTRGLRTCGRCGRFWNRDVNAGTRALLPTQCTQRPAAHACQWPAPAPAATAHAAAPDALTALACVAEGILRVGLRDHAAAIAEAILAMLQRPEVVKLRTDPAAVEARAAWLATRNPPPDPRPCCPHGSDAYVVPPPALGEGCSGRADHRCKRIRGGTCAREARSTPQPARVQRGACSVRQE